eukprot:c18687_g1_i1 orf=62-841(+)
MATRVALSSTCSFASSADYQNHPFAQSTSVSLASLVARPQARKPWIVSPAVVETDAWKPWIIPSMASSPPSSCAAFQGYGATETEALGATEGEGCGDAETEALGVTETGRFSVSDETLLARGFELHRTLQDIDLDQLNDLFVKVGFPRRHKQKLERALQHTSSLRWLQEVKSHKLVAFARATGDDVFNAIIWDVVVDPSYQGLGLGKAVMERLMVDLLHKGITNIGLYAEPNVVGFYKPLGYIADPQGIRAMAYSRKGR